LAHAEEMTWYAVNLRRKIENYFSQQYLHACLKEKLPRTVEQN